MSKPTPFRAILRTPADAKRAVYTLQHSQISAETPLEVIIKPYVKTRSQAQNRLYRKRNAIISEETGQDTATIDRTLKELYLVTILSDTDDTFADRVEAVKELRRAGNTEMADYAKALIMDCLVSTAALNVKQMTTYLESQAMWAGELGITFDFKSD